MWFSALRWQAAGVAAVAVAVSGLAGGVPQAAAAPVSPAAAAAAAAARAAVARTQAESVPAADAGMSSRSGAMVRARAAAQASGQPAEITADRTPFSQTFANPDGSFTTTTSVQPRWVKQGSSWAAADATLVQQADGSYTPKAALGGLSLSGGGGTVLATARAGKRWLQVSWPQPLPAPQVSGATATYPAVFPGVDLVLTAGLAGGFSETLVIKDKTAAADPQLAGLTLGVTASSGLAARPGPGGSLGENTASGQPVFYSPPPMAWDSSAAGASAAGPGAPGAGLVTAPASYASGSVRLGIPASLLAEPAADFPVYVDPSYSETPWWENYG